MEKLFFSAMGSDIGMIGDQRFFNLVEEIFEQNEKRFSRFLKDSELSRLNREKSLEVSEEFLEVFDFCSKVWRESEGFFNPLVSAKNLGYVSSYKKPEFLKVREDYNADFALVKREDSVISLAEGQELDFGGVVKGWTVDQVVKKLREEGENDFLIDAAGDIYAAGRKNGQFWRVGVEGLGEVLELSNQAVATSGKNRRNWQNKEGKSFHHIVDVETLDSVKNPLAAITVVGESVAECDAWATAAFAAGEKNGVTILDERGMKHFLCY